jgi:phosphonate transport system ATP-binding protein
MNRSAGLAVVVTLHPVDYALTPAFAGLGRAPFVEIYGPEFEDVFWEGAPQ